VALAIVLLGAMPIMGLEAALARERLAQEPEGTGRISFVHAAPFAETITDTVVTIELNGTMLPGELMYGDASPYFGMPAGTYEIGIFPLGEATPAITATVTISDGQDYTLATAGDGDNQPLELIQVEDDWTVPGPGMAALRVAHLAPFAADLADTQVDVRTDAGDLVDMLENVEYGTFSDYLQVPAGIYDLMVITPGGGMMLLDIPPVVLKDGDVMTVFAAGLGSEEFPLEPLALLQYPQDPARLRVAHLAPFAGEVGDTSVSVWLDGLEVLSDLMFGDTTDYLEVPAGMYNVAIIPTGTMTPAITGTLMLASGIDFTAAAVGNVAPQPLDLRVTADDNMPSPGMVRLRVVHAAPFAAGDVLTEVDVRTDEGDVFEGLENVAYGDVSGYLEIDPATYDLMVTTPGGGTTLLDIPPLALAAGDVATLYVVGDVVNQPLDALVVSGQTRTPTRLQLTHLAPFAEDPADTAVTVTVNGNAVTSGFTFSETTDFIDIAAGVYQVAVTPDGAMDPVLGGALFLTWDERYIAAAIGDGVNWPLDLFVLRDDAGMPAGGMARLRIVHVAPFTSTPEATAVNVVAEDGEPFTDVMGLMYKGVTEFVDVSPGVYDLAVVSPDDDTVLLDIDPFRLFAGNSVTVFIVGDGVNQPLGALIPALETQNVIFMPIILKDAVLP
jgi:hypothetical protein